MRDLRIIKLFDIVNEEVLAGRLLGEKHLGLLLPKMETGTIVLDFDRVAVVSTSYFFAAFWPFWTREDANGPSLFPLIANANREVSEELVFAMEHKRMAVWEGRCDGTTFEPCGYLGVVDNYLSEALERAKQGHGLNAVDLAKCDQTKPTAWNNRLASAYKQRLLRREQSGRRNTYYAPWKVSPHG